jgi:hypothetical protein
MFKITEGTFQQTRSDLQAQIPSGWHLCGSIAGEYRRQLLSQSQDIGFGTTHTQMLQENVWRLSDFKL